MEKPTKAVLSMVYSMEKAAIHGWTVATTPEITLWVIEKAMDNSFGPMAITTQGRFWPISNMVKEVMFGLMDQSTPDLLYKVRLMDREQHEPNGQVYVGEFKNGQFHGEGQLSWPKGDLYIGHFNQGTIDSFGHFDFANNFIYEGMLKDGQFHGIGELTMANGDVYKGSFMDGEKSGFGRYTWSNGTVYVGHFKYNQYHGEGSITFPDGAKQEGLWESGERIN